MSGADPFGEEDADAQCPPEQDFMRKPVWQRLIVMFAGPAANLVLPFVLFTAVLMAGEPQPDPTVGAVLPGTPAATLGLAPGDTILAVDDEPIVSWVDVMYALDGRVSQDLRLTVSRDGVTRSVAVPASALAPGAIGGLDFEAFGLMSARVSSRVGVDDPGSPAWNAGLRTGDAIVAVGDVDVRTWNELEQALSAGASHPLKVLRVVDSAVETLSLTLAPVPDWAPREGDASVNAWGLVSLQVFVSKVADDSAAAAAGIQPGDRLFQLDGEQVLSWSGLVRAVSATVPAAGPDAQPRPLALTVVRDGVVHELRLTPRLVREIVRTDVRWRPIMGIERYSEVFVAAPSLQRYHSLIEAVPRGFGQAKEVFVATLSVLANVFTGKFYFNESVGGPIAIFHAASEGAKQGIFAYARLVGTISFSLGIVNLLPVPVLDGGQIVFYTIEGLRGRPLSLELREKVQMAGILALALLMLVVTVNDVSRWIGS